MCSRLWCFGKRRRTCPGKQGRKAATEDFGKAKGAIAKLYCKNLPVNLQDWQERLATKTVQVDQLGHIEKLKHLLKKFHSNCEQCSASPNHIQQLFDLEKLAEIPEEIGLVEAKQLIEQCQTESAQGYLRELSTGSVPKDQPAVFLPWLPADAPVFQLKAELEAAHRFMRSLNQIRKENDRRPETFLQAAQLSLQLPGCMKPQIFELQVKLLEMDDDLSDVEKKAMASFPSCGDILRSIDLVFDVCRNRVDPEAEDAKSALAKFTEIDSADEVTNFICWFLWGL